MKEKTTTTKKTTKKATTRKPRTTKVATAVSDAQLSAFEASFRAGNNVIQSTTGFVAGATNGLVIRPVRSIAGYTAKLAVETAVAASVLMNGSRRRPVKAQGRKS